MLYIYIATASILSIIAILYSLQNGYNGQLYILGFHKNALGLVIGYSIPIILGFYELNKNKAKYKKIFIPLIILNTVALLLTFSRGSMLGAVSSCIILFMFMNKSKSIVIISIIIYIVSIILLNILPSNILDLFFDFSQNSSAYSRVLIFTDAIYKIKQNLWLGSGIGSYFIRLPAINFSQDDPNNVLLLNLLELGIVGLIIFILLNIYIYYYAVKNMRLFKFDKELFALNAIFISAFTARLVHVQVDVMWVRGNSLFMFAMVGMLFALRIMYKNKCNEQDFL